MVYDSAQYSARQEKCLHGSCGRGLKPPSRRRNKSGRVQPLPELQPERARANALQSQELPVEVGDVDKAASVGHFRDIQVVLHQQPAGLADAQFIDELRESLACVRPEEAAGWRLAQAEYPGRLR